MSPKGDRDPNAREAAADEELRQLLSNLEAEAANSTSTSTERAREEKEAVTAFPTEMSCITAFDEMYYCYSLGGQFLNVYRYGELRSCGEKAADWRFCMRTRSYGPIARKAMIMARFKEKTGRYKVGRSSEDVWEVRRVPVVGAFGAGGREVREGVD
ncbi:hypothetical protein C7212DRAFT_279386 [Tuber magnatum]|uniref:Early meiotic induction protein 1 n=1 Tax=Tuber magnatum TaxID=42249 RepID=A0A317SQH1_9PEZI|nr:hypothetical protein C7212DRAFT_279386 [Tuber magnatum]